RAPPWIAPMHPRLDWQLWFAALGNYQQNYWFMPFMGHISRGNPEVLAFFSVNPFPDEPPKYLRAMRFTYHFTTDYDDPNHWWKREPVDMYAPMISRNVTVDDQRTDTSPQN
ncbi:MAG: lipase maturation factor family protein, partial [Candidatus Lindowbacteria bacterium]|nr:lipase maturation factor family protein [Candidatus Lindowbacteria bacterium]